MQLPNGVPTKASRLGVSPGIDTRIRSSLSLFIVLVLVLVLVLAPPAASG